MQNFERSQTGFNRKPVSPLSEATSAEIFLVVSHRHRGSFARVSLLYAARASAHTLTARPYPGSFAPGMRASLEGALPGCTLSDGVGWEGNRNSDGTKLRAAWSELQPQTEACKPPMWSCAPGVLLPKLSP
jgi:hypothetical protein